MEAMPRRAQGVLPSDAHNSGKEPQRLWAAAIRKRASLHLCGQDLGMPRYGIHRALKRLTGQRELNVIGQ
jgi:hypothetical protein